MEVSMYEQMIREAMARLGRIGEQDPAIVEAWMRLEHGTLSHRRHSGKKLT